MRLGGGWVWAGCGLGMDCTMYRQVGWSWCGMEVDGDMAWLWAEYGLAWMWNGRDGLDWIRAGYTMRGEGVRAGYGLGVD